MYVYIYIFILTHMYKYYITNKMILSNLKKAKTLNKSVPYVQYFLSCTYI